MSLYSQLYEHFQPYWKTVVRTTVEVLTENNFHPYPASYSRPDGVVASGQYWETFKRYNNPAIYEAKHFLELLKNEQTFVRR